MEEIKNTLAPFLKEAYTKKTSDNDHCCFLLEDQNLDLFIKDFLRKDKISEKDVFDIFSKYKVYFCDSSFYAYGYFISDSYDPQKDLSSLNTVEIAKRINLLLLKRNLKLF